MNVPKSLLLMLTLTLGVLALGSSYFTQREIGRMICFYPHQLADLQKKIEASTAQKIMMSMPTPVPTATPSATPTPRFMRNPTPTEIILRVSPRPLITPSL